MAIKKAELMDLIHVIKKFMYCRKNKSYKFNVYYRKNELSKFLYLMRVAGIGLNHLVELS